MPVLLSKLFSTRDTLHTYDLGELGRHYRAYRTLMTHWRDVLPDGAMIDVRYEDVVSDLEGQARRIVAHCGLEWDDACLAFHGTERAVNTASVVQVRQPLYTSSVGRAQGLRASCARWSRRWVERPPSSRPRPEHSWAVFSAA